MYSLVQALLGILTIANASVVLPGDGPYYYLRQEPILYIYDPSTREAIPQISAYMQTIRKDYDLSFGWRLDERQDLILASPRQQIPNAYATIVPNIKTVWFPPGAALLEHMAQSSWFLTLATHETTHLYQLNAKVPFTAALKRVFGNSGILLPFIWPIILHPNFITPTFMLEGNAVLNESRANLGGRLHSGEVRALVVAQIQAGMVNSSSLINNQFRFPYGQTAYAQGGYFQAHLAGKHGIEKTNQFFVSQADHYLWPLILNKTFRQHFGSSYPQEIREYLRGMDQMAKNQKFSAGSTLINQEFIGSLNHDEKRIFFVSSNGRQLSVLHSLDKSTGLASKQSISLPFGKVFWESDRPRTATTQAHDLHHVEYSLYDENKAFDPLYRGQIVNDMRARKVASMDAANSWLETQVLIDGEPYDVSHSSPILDYTGNVYYFRQNGTERVLYKNRQPVFKYEGFYGILTEVDDLGTVYFIANTAYGSTLYQYKNNEIERVLSSDRVVDARRLNDRQFLAIEINAQGHKAIIVDGEPSPQQPAHYTYAFSNSNLIPVKLSESQSMSGGENRYNSFTQLRYSGLDFISTIDGARGLGLYLGGHFVDPMEYQDISLIFSGSQLGSQAFLGQYLFTKYLPNFFAQYYYQKEFWTQLNGADRVAYNQQVALGVLLPVLRWRHWDAHFTIATTYNKEDIHYDNSFASALSSTYSGYQENYGSFSRAQIEYNVDASPALNFHPWRNWHLSYFNKLESLPGQWKKKYNTSMVQTQWIHGFPMEFYANLSGHVAWAENHDVDVAYDQMPLSLDIRIPRLTPWKSYTAQTVSSVRFEFTKVFNVHSYSPRIPIGLDRLAPLVIAQGIFFDNKGAGHGRYPANIFEWGVGADFQLLIAHIASAKIRVLNAFDTRYPRDRDTQVQLIFKHKF